MSHEDLYRFISGWKYAALATAGREWPAQAALVGIAVTRDLELVFDTLRSSRKYANLKANAACAFVIGCDEPATVQYEGLAEELAGEDLAKYQRVYFEKFSDGPNRLAWPGIVYFVVRPRWIRFSDFSQATPQVEEFRFGAD